MGRSWEEKVSATIREIVSDVPGPETFVLPAPLCLNAFSCETDGRMMRVLMALLWFSSPWLKRNIQTRIFVSLFDLRFMSGLESQKSNTVLRRLVKEIRDVKVRFSDGVSMNFFEDVSLLREDGVDRVAWVISSGAAELFSNPKQYAIINVLEAREMTAGIDMVIYQNVRLVWNKKNRSVKIARDAAYRATGYGEDAEMRRVLEKIRKSATRVGSRLGVNVMVKAERARGSRSVTGLNLVLESTDGPGAGAK